MINKPTVIQIKLRNVKASTCKSIYEPLIKFPFNFSII
jgi:hypothetical protein